MSKALTIARSDQMQPANAVTPLVAAWQAQLQRQVLSGEIAEATATTYIIGMAKLLSWIEGRGYVSEDLVRDWIGDVRTAYEPTTASTWLSGVKNFFAWAESGGRIPFNPSAGIRGAKRSGTGHAHRRDQLTDREVLRVLESPADSPIGKRDRAILALMAYTAIRTIEIYHADLENLKTENGRLVLYVHGKGRARADELVVIAHPDAEGALRDWLAERGDKPGPLFVSLSPRSAGDRLSRSHIRHLVKHYFKAAGVRGDRKTTHSLRHTAITNAIRHGAPVQKVQAMARHSNISTTMIYFHEVDRVENPAEQFIAYGGEEK